MLACKNYKSYTKYKNSSRLAYFKMIPKKRKKKEGKIEKKERKGRRWGKMKKKRGRVGLVA